LDNVQTYTSMVIWTDMDVTVQTFTHGPSRGILHVRERSVLAPHDVTHEFDVWLGEEDMKRLALQILMGLF
jgi:hypothetical protein